MERNKVEHKQKVTGIKQEHTSDMDKTQHEVNLQLEAATTNTNLGQYTIAFNLKIKNRSN